ncbi:MAG: PAS domain S-box protein [Elainella sp. C42_A2020_010]|nr:PAS domain S-box protein [Elainella sp. C42_A2020_010]
MSLPKLPKLFPLTIHVPLRWALTVPFVLLTVGATALVGYLSYRSGQKAVDDLRHQLVLGINDRVTQELKTYLQTPLLINRLNVDAANQGQIDLQDIPALEAALFNRLQQFDQQVSAVLFANPEGLFRLVDRLPNLYLVAANASRPDRILVYRLDSQGKRRELVTTLKGLDVRRDRSWYERAVRTGQPGWSPISQYGSTKLLTLDASHPIYDPATKQLLGVFAVHLRLDYLSEFLHRLPISRSGRVLIMDQQGNLVATSTQEAPYQFKSGIGYHQQFRQLKIYESQDGLIQSLGQYLREHTNILELPVKSPVESPVKSPQGRVPAPSPASKELAPDAVQELDFYHNGERLFVEIMPFQDQHGLSWQIVTVIPQSHFLAEIQHNARTTALLCLLTLAGAIGVGLWAANWFISHFAQLNRASQELAAGNLKQRLPTNSPIAELNGLAQTFNQMADQLQQSFERIRTALEESEEKFTTIFRTSPDPIAIASLAEGRLLDVNDSLIEFFGYSRSEMIGCTTTELNFWHDLAQRDQCRSLLYQQGSAQNLEVQLCLKSGEVRTVLLSAGVQTLDGQECVIVMHRDISDRKAAELALRRYERIVSATTDAVSLVDRQYRYQIVNQTYLDWNQKSYSEIVGYTVDELMGADIFRAVVQPYLDRCLAGETIQYHEWFEFPTLGRQFVSVTYAPYLEADQTISGVVVSVRNITQLKQAEEALRQSEERFREIAQTINQIFFVQAAATEEYLYISPAYEKIWGLSCESLYQDASSWLDVIHPDDRAAVLESLDFLVEQGGVRVQRNYRIIQANGAIRWISAQIFPVCDQAGQPSHYIGLVEDITERKQAEEALQEREAMLRAIGDNLPKGFIYQRVYEPGKGSYYSYISAGIERLLGLKPEAVIADPKLIRSVGFDEDLAIADRVVQESLQNLSPVELQMRNRTVGGKIQWSSIRSTPRRLEDGRIVWDGIEVDITDLKQTEAALRASEALFRGAFDNAPIGISLVSLTGQFVKVNACYCDLLGYSEAELLGLSFPEITHPDDVETDWQGFRQMMAGEIRSFQMEKRYITKQGTIVPVLMNAALIRDPSGQPLYCVGQVQDIRDRQKVERMKDEFISVVSHELRTPLTSIRGALGILGSGVFNDRPEKAAHMLSIAMNNSDRLARLVDDILTLERLESGKVELAMERCQASDLIQQAVDSVQAIADQSQITLAVMPSAIDFWASPDAIIQTLTNLLSNAIKFSAPGQTVWLKVEMREIGEMREKNASPPSPSSPFSPSSSFGEAHEPPPSPSSPPPPYILFTVQDQGRGIPAEKLDIIFEQFQQVDVSDSRKKGGTGLGLAICKKIVQQHGGQIWAESSLGEGSALYFTLPLNQDH